MDTLRAFIALELPDRLRHELSLHAKRFSGLDKHYRMRWLPPENYHLTLAFLGNITPGTVSRLSVLLNSLQQHPPVFLQFRELSSFPFSKTPKVAAALLERSSELAALQEKVVRVCRSAGVVLERRRFEPHVTMGRMRRSRKPLNLPPISILLSGKAEVVVLYESELTRHGAVYTPLSEVKLEDDEP